MHERLTAAARAMVAGVSTFAGDVAGAVSGWVRGGDITAIAVLLAIAVVLLLFIVAPSGRRY